MKSQRARSDRATLTAEYVLVIATIVVILAPTFIQLSTNACNIIKSNVTTTSQWSR